MILKRGSKGPGVIDWQRFLHLKIDGSFGKMTEEATRAFQKHNGLDVDGQVGKATIAKAVELGYGAVVVEKPVDVPKEAAQFEGETKIDRINAAKLATVAPVLRARVLKFIALAKADGMIIQVTQGLRTFAEQEALYAQGRSRKGRIVTNARGGQSNHNYGMAVDVAPVVDGKVSFNDKLYKFGKWAEAAGLDWGGNWKKFTDLPHLQIPGVPKPGVLFQVYAQHGLSEIWAKYGGK